ncbi:hypothetical protein ACXC9Q_14080 [Kribbella sp. CWNU-51]
MPTQARAFWIREPGRGDFDDILVDIGQATEELHGALAAGGLGDSASRPARIGVTPRESRIASAGYERSL